MRWFTRLKTIVARFFRQNSANNNGPISALEKEVAILKRELEGLRQTRQHNFRCFNLTNNMDKINIEKLIVEKIELNIDGINVDDLSGMLNVGITPLHNFPLAKKNKPPPHPSPASAPNIKITYKGRDDA